LQGLAVFYNVLLTNNVALVFLQTLKFNTKELWKEQLWQSTTKNMGVVITIRLLQVELVFGCERLLCWKI
jgi:hypothetical protein